MCFNVEYLIFCKLYISVESGAGDTAAMEAAGDCYGAGRAGRGTVADVLEEKL